MSYRKYEIMDWYKNNERERCLWELWTIVFSLDSMNEVVLIRISYSYTISVLVSRVLQVVEVMLVVAVVVVVAADAVAGPPPSGQADHR